MEKRELFYTVGGNVNWYNHYGEHYEVPQKNGKQLPYDPEILPLGIYPEETIIQQDTCTPMFTAVLITIANIGKQS